MPFGVVLPLPYPTTMLTVCPSDTASASVGFPSSYLILTYLHLLTFPFGLTGAYSVGVCIALSTSPGSTAILDALEWDIGKGDTLRHTPAIRLVRRLSSALVALSSPRSQRGAGIPGQGIRLSWTPIRLLRFEASAKLASPASHTYALYARNWTISIETS